MISLVYIITNKKKVYSGSLSITMIILPAVVTVIIMLVGSNIARAFSLAGAFSLVRFRSTPGDSKDISYVFLSMAIGLATGMGYIGFAAIVTLILCLTMILLSQLNFGVIKTIDKQLRITIPEDMNYQNVFDDLFQKYTNKSTLERVKTTNLGTLYELTYGVTMKNDNEEKEFLDELRTRNGNLNIILSLKESNAYNVL